MSILWVLPMWWRATSTLSPKPWNLVSCLSVWKRFVIARVSFSLFLTVLLHLRLPACLFLFFSLPPPLSPHLCVKYASLHFSRNVIECVNFSISVCVPSLFLPLRWFVRQSFFFPFPKMRRFLLLGWVTVLKSHLRSSDLCESLLFQKVSPLRLHLTSFEDDNLSHCMWALNYVAHSSGYHTAPATAEEDWNRIPESGGILYLSFPIAIIMLNR